MSVTRFRLLRVAAVTATLFVSAREDGSFTVSNARNGFAKTYAAP